MKLQEIHSFSELASALNISKSYLYKISNNRKRNYIEIEIPKKNGTVRKIYSPNNELLKIQCNLLELLENSVRLHRNAHGFIKGRSILTNAKGHVAKEIIVNIDLEDFFENISSGRVYSMFKNYLKINKDVASVITNLCCHDEGFLPQGAPTSPMISNILCKSMDKELTGIANQYKFIYSRYADDITFSTNTYFPEKFINIENNQITLGEQLINIIEKNGFFINHTKTWYANRHQSQVVTGIKVNEFINVNRSFVRNIRATLYSLSSNLNDLSIPLDKFKVSYPGKSSIDQLLAMLKGKLMYLKMVKGSSSSVYLKYADYFNDVIQYIETTISPIQFNPSEHIEHKVCLIKEQNIVMKKESKGTELVEIHQGSGFVIKNKYVVTNYHVVENIFESLNEGWEMEHKFPITLYTGRKCEVRLKAKIVIYNKDYDYVVLELEDTSFVSSLEINWNRLKKGSEVHLLGYPEFEEKDEMVQVKGEVTRYSKKNRISNIEITAVIHGGISGGPVTDKHHNVIGIATEGKGWSTNKVLPLHLIKDKIESLD